jgi:UPF0042 nucleotide-binding protein
MAVSEASAMIVLLSYGLKHGPASGANVVYSATSIQNPHGIRRLRELDGRSPEVQGWLLARGGVEKLVSDIVYGAAAFHEQGLDGVLAVGCHGGRHRSVAIVEMAADRLVREMGINPKVKHRDLK